MRQPRTPHHSAAADAQFVGREAELERIVLLLSSVSAGRGRVVLLSGEPGVGKTRLASQALTHAATLGIRSFIGRCFEQQTALPFFPFTEGLYGCARRCTA